MTGFERIQEVFAVSPEEEAETGTTGQTTTVTEVVEELYRSSQIAHVRVAKLLKDKYL